MQNLPKWLVPLHSPRVAVRVMGNPLTVIRVSTVCLSILQIADHAKPGGMYCLLEIQDIIVWLNRFKTKHFDQCLPSLFENGGVPE